MADINELAQEFVPIEPSGLLGELQDLKTAGWRLGQACATKLADEIEVMYSLEKENALRNLTVMLPAAQPVLQSATATYPYAFIYENEMHDLFGITFKNLSLDYGGKFFRVAQETPWNPAPEGGDE